MWSSSSGLAPRHEDINILSWYSLPPVEYCVHDQSRFQSKTPLATNQNHTLDPYPLVLITWSFLKLPCYQPEPHLDHYPLVLKTWSLLELPLLPTRTTPGPLSFGIENLESSKTPLLPTRTTPGPLSLGIENLESSKTPLATNHVSIHLIFLSLFF